MKFKFSERLNKTHFWHRIYGPTSWQTGTDLSDIRTNFNVPVSPFENQLFSYPAAKPSF